MNFMLAHPTSLILVLGFGAVMIALASLWRSISELHVQRFLDLLRLHAGRANEFGEWLFDGHGRYRLFSDPRLHRNPVHDPITWVCYKVTGVEVKIARLDQATILLGLSKTAIKRIVRATDTPATKLSKRDTGLRYAIQEILEIPSTYSMG